MERTHRYDDIIDLPHHVSQTHRQMSMTERAAQFSPFAALTGYDAAIRETGRYTDERPELDESRMLELNRELTGLVRRRDTPEIRLVYFQPDARKSGGALTGHRGFFKGIDSEQRCLLFTDGFRVPLEDLYSLEPLKPEGSD